MNVREMISGKCAPWQVDIAAVVVCGLATVLAYGAVLKPLQAQRTEYARGVQDLSRHQKHTARMTTIRFELAGQLAEVQQALAERKTQLRPVDQVNRRMAELTAMVNRCGLKTGNVSVGQVSPGPRCHTIPIQISASGDYRSCVRFLHELAAPMSDFAVAGFEIRGDPQKPQRSATFSFDLYWYAAIQATAAK